MRENQSRRMVCQRLPHNLPRDDDRAVDRAFKQVGGIQNLVLRIEINDFENFVFQIAHRMVQIFDFRLLGLHVWGIDNLLFEICPGHVLHQFDAESGMPADTLDLLQLFRRSR